jgi:hypothetical protein
MLSERLLAPGGAVRLFATTPPPAHLPATALSEAAAEFAGTARRVSPDGLVVYDLQDERARNSAPRPYPFVPRRDAPEYARALARASDLEAICFKAIGDMDEGQWYRWLNRRAEDGNRLLVPVGRPASAAPRGAMNILRSIALVAEHSAGFTPGSVVIAERGGPDNGELRRMLARQAAGCAWFISQTVYDAPRTVSLLKLYVRECHKRGIPPRRVVLSFAPCGGPRTLAFMEWLGIAVPAGIRGLLANSATPLSDSIRVCTYSLRRVLEAVEDVPLGFCVESLSSNRAQLEASLDLFAELSGLMQDPSARVAAPADSAAA